MTRSNDKKLVKLMAHLRATKELVLSLEADHLDTDNYKKLVKLMAYLQATKELVLTLKADHLDIMEW